MLRLLEALRGKLIDFIAWVDGDDRELTDWASDHVAADEQPGETREPGPFGMARYDR